MLHFVHQLFLGAAAVATCKGDFKGAEGDHLALAVIKSDELGVILAFFNLTAGVKGFFAVVWRYPTALSDEGVLYLIPIVLSAAELIEIQMHEGGDLSAPRGTADTSL